MRALGQCSNLNTGSSWIGFFKVTRHDGVYGIKITEIRQRDIDFHRVIQCAARCFRDCLEILKDLLRLCADVALDDGHG